MSPAQVVALVPAYNEAATIAATIGSLRAQARPPDVIAVVPNNCTDDTAAVARAHGAYVIDMGTNPDRKAGAINHGLNVLDPYRRPHDLQGVAVDYGGDAPEQVRVALVAAEEPADTDPEDRRGDLWLLPMDLDTYWEEGAPDER